MTMVCLFRREFTGLRTIYKRPLETQMKSALRLFPYDPLMSHACQQSISRCDIGSVTFRGQIDLGAQRKVEAEASHKL